MVASRVREFHPHEPRILLAPGPFKECMDSSEVCKWMERGIQRILSKAVIKSLPMSDGGSGLIRRFEEHIPSERITCRVSDPLGREIDADYIVCNRKNRRTAVIESAQAAGLVLVPPEERDPGITTTYGVGQLLRDALDRGCRSVTIGCGDSGTNDGGAGFAQALGYRFLDKLGHKLEPGGMALSRLAKIDSRDVDPRLGETEIIVACNISSILCGPEGTSLIYGKQKQSHHDPDQLKKLDTALFNYAARVRECTGVDIRYVPGGGGAGGLASAAYGLCNAKLRYSIHVVAEVVALDDALQSTDLVLTGEGRMDARTASGKVVCGVALMAKKYDLPVVGIVGSIAEDVGIVYFNGVDYVESIAPGPFPLKSSIENAGPLIAEATSRVMRALVIGGAIFSSQPTRLT